MTTSASQVAARERASGLFAVGALVAMALTLAYVRFVILPAQASAEPLGFSFRNPMLDAVPGERVLQRSEDDPSHEQCVVVRAEGVVLRPYRGPERIRQLSDLRHQPAYLACSMRDVEGPHGGCGGEEAERDVILYGLNHFGMPVDANTVAQSLMPERVRWGDRTVTVLRVALQRYGLQAAAWSTWLAHEAPVTGAVRMETLRSEGRTAGLVFREVLPAPDARPAGR